MDHDHDIGAELHGLDIAGFLVPAVAPVPVVDEDAEAELPGEGDGAVPARIVDEDDVIDPFPGDVVERPFERLLGVIGGHDDDDLLRTFHGHGSGLFYSTFALPGEWPPRAAAVRA
jgi:hypothetical protein